jgi:hypothetical protein
MRGRDKRNGGGECGLLSKHTGCVDCFANMVKAAKERRDRVIKCVIWCRIYDDGIWGGYVKAMKVEKNLCAS